MINIMGLFSKIKAAFKKESKDVNTYEKGLSKTRKSFVNKLANLSKEYGEINDNYFEELEELLINADIGVNTVITDFFVYNIIKMVDEVEIGEFLFSYFDSK